MGAVWDLADFDDHEGVHLIRDTASGLTASGNFSRSTLSGGAFCAVTSTRFPRAR